MISFRVLYMRRIALYCFVLELYGCCEPYGKQDDVDDTTNFGSPNVFFLSALQISSGDLKSSKIIIAVRIYVLPIQPSARIMIIKSFTIASRRD